MIGSTWKKWDLHFHSPASYDYKDKSISNEEIIRVLIEKQISVVAITDHHIIDVKRIKHLQELGKGVVTVLPGIEFRAELGGKEAIHYIGIFSELANIEEIWTDLQTHCCLKPSQVLEKGDDLIYCDLQETCRIIHELGGLISVHAGGKSNSIESIKNNLEFKKALKVELVKHHIDIFECGQVEDQEDYKKIVFPSIGLERPLIICSDNHDVKNYVVKQNFWIKAEPTFEGLRQILFEPTHRTHIGEFYPIDPPIRINQVKFDFPANSTFENEGFCLKGKAEIHFSPNFTCLIGGRGTGKSTILNLIHEKLKPGENDFFKLKKIKDPSGKTISVDDAVSIDNDTDEKYIEFLSQNEVEEFAADYQKLTLAIYQRLLKRDEKGIITLNEKMLGEKLSEFRTHIATKRRIRPLESLIDQKQKELATNTKIVESFSSDDYVKINEAIKAITSELNELSSSQKEHEDLKTELNNLVEKYKKERPNNLHAIQTNKIVADLEVLISTYAPFSFKEEEDKRDQLGIDLINKKEELRKYLSDKGLTEDNLNDISNANIIASHLEIEIAQKKEELEQVNKTLSKFDKSDAKRVNSDYQNELEVQLKLISDILENVESKSVKPITLRLEFDVDAANEKVFDDFKLVFEGQINQSNHKGDAVLKEVLFCITPAKVTTKEILLESLRTCGSSSAAKGFLIDLFTVNENFELYKLLVERTFLNLADFKKIKVFYDNRPIENSSFGQRCTAVLVILLLLGNNPIIIDEPEAHLDSYLIANYLVDVIKRSKQNRQIIFATHNANFVVNGDAELIHILHLNEASGTTTIQSTTIENETTKETLISLEGGRDAFMKRENKYQFLR